MNGDGSLASSDGGVSVQVARAFGYGVVAMRAEGGGGRRGRSAAVAVGRRSDLLALLNRLERVLLRRRGRSIAVASGRRGRGASCLLLSLNGGLGGVVWKYQIRVNSQSYAGNGGDGDDEQALRAPCESGARVSATLLA